MGVLVETDEQSVSSQSRSLPRRGPKATGCVLDGFNARCIASGILEAR